jgi:hypothetical protein
MSNDELTKKYAARFAPPVRLLRVESVNFKPHPFMIGTRHVAHAADKCCGMLGEETMRAIPCAQRGCRSSFEEHVHDTVAFLELTRDASQDETRAVLLPLCKEIEDDDIDGVAFVKSGFKFED